MSNRETRLEPVQFLQVGGVNQRKRNTELRPESYSDIQGVFPEFDWLQSRIWGKRTLNKFSSSIFGIHQFWTPLGYAAGLYQFNGTLDYGIWLTPLGGLTYTPPPLNIDLNGNTLDDFGYPNLFGFGDIPGNPSLVNTPNDTNGGPAGQGKKCSVQDVTTDYPVIDFIVAQSSGSISNTALISDTDNCRNPIDGQNPPCVAFPPLPVPLQSPPSPTLTTVIPDGNLNASKEMNSIAVFTTPSNLICAFRTTCEQGNTVSDTKMTLNFASLQDRIIERITLLATKIPGGSIEIDIGTGGFENFDVQASTYLTLGTPTLNADQGFHQIGSIAISSIRVYERKRVCV